MPQVTLSLEGGISTIMEGGSVNLIATLAEELPGGVPEPLIVELAVEGVSDGDYSLPDEIVIPTSGMMGMVELTIDNDNLAEFAERLTVSVARLGYGTNRSAPQVESSVGVTIELNNNDRITATILASDLTEAVNAVAVVTIELDRALPAGLAANEVQLVLVNTGDRADDVSGLPMNIADVFGGGTMALVPLPLMDDMILEGPEVVTLKLAVSDRLKPIFANEDTARGSFNINDNEDGTVIIATPVKTAYDENENIGLTVELPSGVNAGAPITVNYEISFPNVGSTAPADSADITTTSREVTIAANTTSVLLTIMLNDDEALEETELLRVTLTGVSTTNGATVVVGGQSVDLTILDDEDLTYLIEGADKIGEDGGNYTVRLRRTGDITADATVAYTVSGGSGRAAEAADFAGNTFTDGNFVFTGYDALSDEITFTIENDGDSEGAETFQISVNGGTPTTTKSKEVTINDDDATLVTVRRGGSDSGPVDEGDMITFEATLVDGTLATENLVVTLAARPRVSNPDGGTAADVTVPASVMIAMGTSIATFTVSADDDSDAEYAETVNIYVTHVGVDEIMDDGYDLTIASDDDDKITVTSLEVLSSSNLNEGGTANVRITLSDTLPSRTPPDALSLVLSDSANDGMDVTIPLTDITPGLESSATADVAITLVNDDLLEALETIELELRIDSTKSPDLADVLDVSGASTSFMLADADMGQVSIATLSKTSYNENEDVMVTVELPSGLTAGTNITVNYELIVTTTDEDDKANADDIEGPTTDSITINENARMAIITIDLKDDSVAEFTEQLGIRLTSVSGATGVTFDNAITNVMILDNEDPVYTLEGAAMVVEDAGTYTVRARRRGRTSVTSVAYTVGGADVTAADFGGTGMLPSGSFTFSGNEALSADVSIPIADDSSLEKNETFQITAGGATKDVMIIDDDDASAEVRVGSAGSTVTEGGSAITLEVGLTNAPDGAPENLTIQLSARAHTSAPDGGTDADVRINPTSVMINKGESTVTFEVRAFDDDDVEYDEKVNIYVDEINDAMVNTDSGVDLTVTSEDQITVTALRVLTTPNTEGGTATVEITLSESLPSRTLANALALVLSDSTNDGLDVTIPATDITQDLKTNRRVTVPISLLDDALLEADEEIELELRIDSSQNPNLADVLDVSGESGRTSFTLSDADSGEVSIVALPKTSYNESEDVTVTVALPSGLTAGTDITVEYVLTYPTNDGGTLRVAANADDVVGSPVPVTIMAGEPRASFVIDLNDDSVAEETELVGVRLTRASGAPGTDVTHDVSVVQFRILDNEDPEYTLVGDGTVNEDSTEDGSYEVRARRRGRTDVLSVGYTVTGTVTNSADAVDFIGNAFPFGTFTFSGNDALSTAETIDIFDDILLEDDEFFEIVIGEARHEVKLVDNDAPTVFVRYTHAVSRVTVNEGESVDLVAVLQNAPGGATEKLTVSLAARAIVGGATDSGTADDVRIIPSTITIPVGASKVTFAVRAVFDGMAGYDERVNIYANDVAYGSENRNPGDSGAELTVVSADQVKAKITFPPNAEGNEGETIRALIELDQLLPPRTPDGVLSLVLLDGSTTNDDFEIVYKDLAADLKSSLSTYVTINLKSDKRVEEGDETASVKLRVTPGHSPDLADIFPSDVEGSFKIIDKTGAIIGMDPPITLDYYESVGGANSVAETVDFIFKLPDGIIADIPVRVYYSMGIAEIGSGSETAYGPLFTPGLPRDWHYQPGALPSRCGCL